MSVADAPQDPVESSPPPAPRPPSFFQQFGRFLYTQNPFYLLSVAFVLHSTRLWYRQAAGPFDPWPLMGIICGYIVVVAATGFVLVRFGKVWDDARSILLILLLLFVELSTTFDGVLVSQPATGRTLLAIGLALAVVVSEGVLIGLRIRLPALYRIPYHLFLVLLFLYPLAIVTGLGDDTSAAVWRVYLFSPVAAAVMLTLLPAVRRGAQYVAHSGTPWRWPLFPWALFVFLMICAGLRAWALAMSFDTVLMQKFGDAMRMDSAFGLYFLVPMLLAVALLLLEAGIVGGNRSLQNIALALPFVCLWLSATPAGGSAPYANFLYRFTLRIGSPLWLAAWAALAFIVYARLRQVRSAGTLFWVALLVASCVSPTTTDMTSVVIPEAWALWFATVVQGFVGLRRRQSWRVFAATICVLGAVRSDFPAGIDPLYRDVFLLHLAGMTVLLLAAMCADPFATFLRRAGVPMLVVAALCAASFSGTSAMVLPPWLAPLYGACVVASTFTYAYVAGGPAYFFAGVVNLALLMGRLLYELAGILRRLFDWEGATWFVWGLVWLALGVLISVWKSGLAGRLIKLVPQARNRVVRNV